jgi:hypothetical protein
MEVQLETQRGASVVMTDYETIRAPEEAVQAAREAKREDETWGDFLLRCTDADVPRKWTEAELRRIVRDETEQALSDGGRKW